MATKPRPWPNNAEWAREDAISLATAAIDLLDPVVQETEKLTDIEIIRRASEAQKGLLKILSKLQSVK